MNNENETKIFEKMIGIYKYNKGSKTITYESNGNDLFKRLLFKFCFLKDKGTAKFGGIKDIWFFQSFESSKKKILLDIIDLFIYKINNKNNNIHEKMEQMIESLIDLESKDILLTFKYLQSIYSYYTDKIELILFPLFYSLAFSKDIQSYLKADIIAILDSFKENYPYDKELLNDIDFTNINVDFLSKINILVYNMKKKAKINDILPLYKYLCSYGSLSSPLNEQYTENFSYFSFIKNNDLDKKIDIKIQSYKKDKVNNNSNINLAQNDDNIIVNNKNTEDSHKTAKEASTNNDSSEEKENPKVENENEKPSNKRDENLKKVLLIGFKYSDAKSLCSNILNIFNVINIDKSYLDEIHELKIQNLNYQILLNKLSSAIVLLQNANIFNIKRKITECLIFEIVEKYYRIFTIPGSYYPKKSNLIDLKNLISEKIKKYEGSEEKTKIEKAQKDKENLEEILEKYSDNSKANNNNEQNSDKIFLYVNTTEKNGMKLFTVYEFLKFCKKFFHGYVHASSNKIDYYLLPRTLFNAEIIYSNYILSLDEFMNNNNIDEDNNNVNNEKNNSIMDIDIFSLYSDNKIINIDKAFEILFSKRNNCFKDILIPELIEKKKEYTKKQKIYQYYFDSFMINNKEQMIEEVTEKEADFYNQLNSFDEIMSEIIEDKLNRNDAKTKMDEIKDIIISTVKISNASIYSLANSTKDVNEIYDNICSEVRKLGLLLNFMEKQREKFKTEKIKIFQDYKETLDDVLEKTYEAKELIKKKYSFSNESLFDKWKESNPPKQLLKTDLFTVKKYMKELITSVRLDLSYSFDEKFVYWAIGNNYSSYFK